MSLIPSDPFRYIKEVQKVVERVFATGPHLISQQSSGAFSIQLEETEDELIAVCHVPGLRRKEEMEINLNGQLLTVARNLSGLYEMKGQEMYKREQFWGHFRQTLPVPCPVTDWSTTFDNEELRIHMSKAKK